MYNLVHRHGFNRYLWAAVESKSAWTTGIQELASCLSPPLLCPVVTPELPGEVIVQQKLPHRANHAYILPRWVVGYRVQMEAKPHHSLTLRTSG